MKKLFISVLVALGFSTLSSAQGKGDVEFGFNAGFNYSFASNGYFQSDTGYGFNGGASAEYYFSDSWGVKAKVIYDQKGWNNGIFVVDNTQMIANYNLDYLTIPVTADWHFGNKKNWYLHFGPYVGFLMNAKETAMDTDVKEGFNSTDFGLAFGIGVKFPVSDKLKLGIEYDGQSGLTDIFKDNNGAEVTNGRGSINVGLFFLMK